MMVKQQQQPMMVPTPTSISILNHHGQHQHQHLNLCLHSCNPAVEETYFPTDHNNNNNDLDSSDSDHSEIEKTNINNNINYENENDNDNDDDDAYLESIAEMLEQQMEISNLFATMVIRLAETVDEKESQLEKMNMMNMNMMMNMQSQQETVLEDNENSPVVHDLVTESASSFGSGNTTTTTTSTTTTSTSTSTSTTSTTTTSSVERKTKLARCKDVVHAMAMKQQQIMQSFEVIVSDLRESTMETKQELAVLQRQQQQKQQKKKNYDPQQDTGTTNNNSKAKNNKNNSTTTGTQSQRKGLFARIALIKKRFGWTTTPTTTPTTTASPNKDGIGPDAVLSTTEDNTGSSRSLLLLADKQEDSQATQRQLAATAPFAIFVSSSTLSTPMGMGHPKETTGADESCSPSRSVMDGKSRMTTATTATATATATATSNQPEEQPQDLPALSRNNNNKACRVPKRGPIRRLSSMGSTKSKKPSSTAEMVKFDNMDLVRTDDEQLRGHGQSRSRNVHRSRSMDFCSPVLAVASTLKRRVHRSRSMDLSNMRNDTAVAVAVASANNHNHHNNHSRTIDIDELVNNEQSVSPSLDKAPCVRFML